MVLGLSIVLPVSFVLTYIARRMMLNDLEKKGASLQEHYRMHNEDPHWHIVVSSPEEAEAKREEIMRLLTPYVDRVVKEFKARERDG